MADFYQTLGVARGASDAEIKTSYRKLAMTFHPDRNNGSKEAEEKFKSITEAYDVLRDPDKRALYDRYGEAGLRGGAGGFRTGTGFTVAPGSPYTVTIGAGGAADTTAFSRAIAAIRTVAAAAAGAAIAIAGGVIEAAWAGATAASGACTISGAASGMRAAAGSRTTTGS